MKHIFRGSTACLAILLLCPIFSGSVSAQTGTPDSLLRITTLLPGTTRPQTVTVSVKNGIARLEGDIVLGPLDKMQNAGERGVVLDKPDVSLYRWPDGEIPYTIAPGFTPQYETLIRRAIDYINGATHLLIVPRTSETYYIDFTPANVCESTVGKSLLLGGQDVSLKDIFASGNGSGCDFPQIVHEIAHAAGLWHEQSREDRDNFVTIVWDNVAEDKEHNFDKHESDGTNIGPYDFSSVMHYGPTDFSKNGLPTIVAKNGEAFGDAGEYSAGDIAAINWMYPDNNCPSHFTLTEMVPPVVRPLVFEVSNDIVSTATIVAGNNTTYDAVTGIVLSPGFVAAQGSTFRAVIEGCGGVFQRGSSPDVEEWLANAGDEQPQAAEPLPAPAVPDLNISPNPFANSTTITYNLPAAQEVQVTVFDMNGQVVARPVSHGYQETGSYEYNFNGENLPAGAYFLVMRAGVQETTHRLVLTH